MSDRQLSKMHRVGEQELCEPDYHLLCEWAGQTGKSNEEVLWVLLVGGDDDLDISVIEEGRFKVILVPNITNICYGRGVGYKIEEIVLSEEIQKISATKIRAKMREDGKLK